MDDYYVALVLKDSVELNGVETKVKFTNGMIGYMPVFKNKASALRWIEPSGINTEVLHFRGKRGEK
jgi:hypothetical protein